MKLLSRITIANTVMVVVAITALTVVQLLVSRQGAERVLERTTEQVSQGLFEQLEARAEYTGEYLSDALINPMYNYDMEGIYELLKPALESDQVLEIIVYDETGRIFHTGQRIESRFGNNLGMPDVVAKTLRQQELYTRITEHDYLFARPLFIGNELMGGLFIRFTVDEIKDQIAQTADYIHETKMDAQQESTVIAVVLAVLFGSVSVAVSFFVTMSIIAPLTELVRHTKRISAGELDSTTPVRRADELGTLAGAFNDMAGSLKERQEAIEFLAYHDHLTELPNRTRFTELLEHYLLVRRSSHQPLAICFIDLDEFKAVNDNFGHQAGDRLLVTVAKRLRRLICGQQDDILLARIGGDEFLLCLPGYQGEEELRAFAKEMIEEIRSPIEIDNEQLVVSGSVGVSVYPHDGHTADELIKCADIAMYHAKAEGKNTVSFFSDEMRKAVRDRALMERRLHMAVRDMSQFEVWYQPFFDTSGSRLLGAEALLRWRIPERGVVSPAEFISVAEETGLIVPIGEWVIKTVCQQRAQWQSVLAEDFFVSVNLSARQLFGQQVAGVLAGELERSGVSPHQVHVEVTESLLMSNEKEAAATLDLLRGTGMQVWLDDFGTGFSSLGYLRKFKVDGLKIDRSFVRDIEVDANDRALCSTIISMAHDLGLEVIAEGIETLNQQEFLAGKGCRIGQGEYFSLPLESTQFEARFFPGKAEQDSLKHTT